MVCWHGNAVVVNDFLCHCNCAFVFTKNTFKPKCTLFCSYANCQSKHYPQLYAIEIESFTEKSSLPNEITMCRICTSNVSCDSGETIHCVAPLVGSLQSNVIYLYNKLIIIVILCTRSATGYFGSALLRQFSFSLVSF